MTDIYKVKTAFRTPSPPQNMLKRQSDLPILASCVTASTSTNSCSWSTTLQTPRVSVGLRRHTECCSMCGVEAFGEQCRYGLQQGTLLKQTSRLWWTSASSDGTSHSCWVGHLPACDSCLQHKERTSENMLKEAPYCVHPIYTCYVMCTYMSITLMPSST